MTTKSIDLAHAKWRKAKASSNSSNCVEVANLGAHAAVRDSKNPDGPALVFGRETFGAFLDGAKRGDFDLR